MGLQSNWQQAVTGVVLVFAVFMDVMNRQKKKKSEQKQEVFRQLQKMFVMPVISKKERYEGF